MRVLVRRTDTQEYYARLGVWVKDRSAAFDFESTMQALGFCIGSRLRNAEIVMAWSNSALDVVFPCDPRLDVLLPEMDQTALREQRA
jgi:hypothetical protein